MIRVRRALGYILCSLGHHSWYNGRRSLACRRCGLRWATVNPVQSPWTWRGPTSL